MCCCGKPTINGQPRAYSWDGKTFSTYPPNPPTLAEGDTLLWDEPGRCGGLDSHSHHFRLVKNTGYCYVLVRHGGGDERIAAGRMGFGGLDCLDTNARYWLMQSMYHAANYAARTSRDAERSKWAAAAMEKRIKVRRRGGRARVEILDGLN